MQLSTIFLPLGLAERVGEKDNSLENVMVNFTKLRGCKMPWVKIQQLVTKPERDAERWKEYLEIEESQEQRGGCCD